MTEYTASPHVVQEKKINTNRTPVMTLAEFDLFDDKEVLEGYLDGLDNEPEPGDNRSKSYWHGWRNGMVDGGHADKDYAQAILAHLVLQRGLLHGGNNA